MRELGYFLNVDKPGGMTSRDVVDQVARAAATKRVGHAGTLDPMATGVLVIAVERATRLVEYVQAQPKTYHARIKLGQTSDTDDVDGRLTAHEFEEIPTRERVLDALLDFTGEIQQRPPNYSALKVDGERAYHLARKGQTPNLEPRPVRIHRIRLFDYSFPDIELGVVCGSGTYIRSLARDLGEHLGTGGVLSMLRRHGIGVFHVESAAALDAVTKESIASLARPMSDAVGSMPRMELSNEEVKRFLLGQELVLAEPTDDAPTEAFQVAVFGRGQWIGIGERSGRILRTIKAGFVDWEDE